MSDTGRINFKTFAARAQEYCTQQFPEATVQIEGSDLRITLATGTYTGHLDRFYRSYHDHGDFAYEMERMTNPLRAFMAAGPTTPAWDEVRANVYCKIEQQQTILGPGGKRPVIPALPFATPDLGVTCVIDFPTHVQHITPDLLAAWGMDIHQVYDQGMQNLRALTQRTTPKLEHIAGVPFWFVHDQDGFAASRVLCPDIVQSWVPSKYRDQLVIGIPCRDQLVIATLAEQGAQPMAFMVAKGMRNLYHLTSMIYTIQDHVLTPFLP